MRSKIKRIWWIGIIILLVLTRFSGIDWGLPYSFHPDERNLAVAVSQLSPNTFFRPNFFAYGQLTIYLSYLLGIIVNVITRQPPLFVSVEGATLFLRIIAVACSVATFFVALKLIELFVKKLSSFEIYLISLLVIFSPAFIQFAHFGTTESLLMLLYTLLTYLSVKMVKADYEKRKKYFLLCGVVVGLAAAAKISSLIFIFLPLASYIISMQKYSYKDFLKTFGKMAPFFLIIVGVLILCSPYNFIAWEDFLSALRYEADVANGLPVFYTRPFLYTVPIIFQFTRIFPYALGLPVLFLFFIGFFALPYSKKFNILRLSFLLYFVPTAFLFAKWTRFMAPVMPLMVIFACIFITRFFEKLSAKTLHFIVILICVAPGLAYLSIYKNPDVRFTASDWIYKNIPENSYILSETANVVDLPISSSMNHEPRTINYQYISFDFYNVDEDVKLQKELQGHLQRADYIFVLSRRVYANHTCYTIQNSELRMMNYEAGFQKDRCKKLRAKYPILNEYYGKLFSGELGFTKVAEFTSYPEARLDNRGRPLSLYRLRFSDEFAEETWTVFDHPTVRIYKRI